MHTERRRTERVKVAFKNGARCEVRHRVQLLDISMTGTLLACDLPLPVGTSAKLRAGLGSDPFTAQLEVRREQGASGKRGQAGLGAVFVSMDESSRRSLEQFLGRASK